jgi:hypothetical protein
LRVRFDDRRDANATGREQQGRYFHADTKYA